MMATKKNKDESVVLHLFSDFIFANPSDGKQFRQWALKNKVLLEQLGNLSRDDLFRECVLQNFIVADVQGRQVALEKVYEEAIAKFEGFYTQKSAEAFASAKKFSDDHYAKHGKIIGTKLPGGGLAKGRVIANEIRKKSSEETQKTMEKALHDKLINDPLACGFSNPQLARWLKSIGIGVDYKEDSLVKKVAAIRRKLLQA